MEICFAAFLIVAPFVVLILIRTKSWQEFDGSKYSPKATIRKFDSYNPYTVDRYEEEIKGIKIRQQLERYEKEKNRDR